MNTNLITYWIQSYFRHRIQTVTLAVISLPLAFIPALAQEPPDAATLPTVQVQAVTEGYAAQSVSIGRRVQTLREIPQSVTVLTRQRLDDQGITNLEQAMQFTPGITIQPAGAGVLYDFYARGFPITNVSFDSVQALPGGGGFDSQPDTAMMERMEVLRGADGLFTGSGQPGGTVNLVRKRPLRQRQTAANASLGSWNNTRAELDVSQPLTDSGSIRARGVLAWQERDFFYDADSAQTRLAYGVVEADIGTRTTLGLGVSWQKDHTPMSTGLTRASDGSDLRLSRSRNFASDWSFYKFETTQVFADLKHAFNEDWSLTANAAMLDETNTFKDAYITGTYNKATQQGLSIRGNAGKGQSKQYGVDIFIDGKFPLFSRTHGLSIGANYVDRDSPGFERIGWNLPEQGMTVGLDFDAHSIPEPAMAQMRKNRNRTTQQSGVYGVARWSLTDAVTLITGARATWYDYDDRNLDTGATNSHYTQNGEITPYAGAVWDFATHYSLYASYTDIFRVQSNRRTASGEPLDPAVGTNYELGVKASTPNERLNASLAVFRIEETNRAQTDPAWPNGMAGETVYINAGEVRSEGVEAEINGEVLHGWQWSAGYTYNTTEYLRDRTATGAPSNNEGKSFRSYAPKHMLRVYTTYALPGALQRWSVSGGMNAQSATYSSNAGLRAKQGDYAVFNASVGYTVSKNLSLRLSVNNLADKVYYRKISTGSGNLYGEPRSVMLTARVRL